MRATIRAAASAAALATHVLVLGGCGGEDDARARTQVLARIDALRDATGAPIQDRRALLVALRETRSGHVEVAAARDRCVAAYTDLIDASALEEEARQAVGKGEKIDTIALAKQLDDATTLLERSRNNMPGCDQAASKLRATKL